MSGRASLGVAVAAALLGGIAGSALGLILHQLWPASIFTRALGASVPFGLEDPLRVDLGVLRASFSFMLRLNLPGLAGMILGGWLALRRP